VGLPLLQAPVRVARQRDARRSVAPTDLLVGNGQAGPLHNCISTPSPRPLQRPPANTAAAPTKMEPLNVSAASAAAHAVGALPDLLALLFERLPPVEQCLTVSRLARAWRRWARPRRERLLLLDGWRELTVGERQLPRWCLAEAWPRMCDRERATAACRAAECGDLERLRWLRAQEPPSPWSAQTCRMAAGGGHLDVLRWLRAQDPPCPWDAFVCGQAAAKGRVGVLHWLRAQIPPCPWDAFACSQAAVKGCVAGLSWLRAQDPPCPWDKEACWWAAYYGQIDALRWLRAQNPPCPWDRAACRAVASRRMTARASGRAAVCAWIDEQPEA
jgi:hypothetical protein